MVQISSVPSQWRLKKSKYTLEGTQCITCKDLFFPPRNLCPFCRRKGEIKPYQFSGKGEIISFTIIRIAPKGFEKYAPYTVAMIKLEEGPTVTGQLVTHDFQADVGMKVKPVFRKITEDGNEGTINYGLKWEITE